MHAKIEEYTIKETTVLGVKLLYLEKVSDRSVTVQKRAVERAMEHEDTSGLESISQAPYFVVKTELGEISISKLGFRTSAPFPSTIIDVTELVAQQMSGREELYRFGEDSRRVDLSGKNMLLIDAVCVEERCGGRVYMVRTEHYTLILPRDSGAASRASTKTAARKGRRKRGGRRSKRSRRKRSRR